MSAASLQRIPVVPADLAVGRPLPWAIYGDADTLLLGEGVVLASPAQVEAILARTPYRLGPAPLAPEPARSEADGPDLCRRAPSTEPLPVDVLPAQPGDVLRVHPLFAPETALPVTLIGQLRGQTLIATLPVDGKGRTMLAVGDPVTVKFFSGTALFAFNSKVTTIYHQPIDHFHLSFPKTTLVTRIRRNGRAGVNLPGTLSGLGGQGALAVSISDLSAGGARLVLPAPLDVQPHARLTLRFTVKLAEDLQEEIETAVQVRTAELQSVDGKKRPTLGVQFLSLSRAHRLHIMALVYRLQSCKERPQSEKLD